VVRAAAVTWAILGTGVPLAALVAQQARPPAAAAATCDRPAADIAIDAAWARWRANDIAGADSLFRAAVQRCPAAGIAWSGLGYVALRRDAVALAIARFDTAFATGAERDADAAIGLGLATFRAGDRARARRAFLLADSLRPRDAVVAEYLARLPAPIDASMLPGRPRPAERQLVARSGDRRLEVRDASGAWRPLWVKALNIGAALPGKHPSEFPPDDGTYEEWIALAAEMGVNTLRLYTIHPPHFYRAVARWNVAHPDRPLWLLHGVWTELPPGRLEEDYDDAAWNAEFAAEARRVIDLLHGNAAIAPRAGHASGLYVDDVSAWTLGYIIGREWEPYSVAAYAARHPRRTTHRGEYVSVSGGNAVDVWLAATMDRMVAYEMTRYNAQRPIAYTNWPTLDPLAHPTESTRAEEDLLLGRRGERVPEASREYDNDAIGLDARLMSATPAFAAGLFASYHAYPYYPDFLILDPVYARAVGREGPSHYLGYLRELVAHHGSMPVVISEYGVPSSRGNAHLQPQGWHHGGHDEAAQARINARLTRDIHESGAAGAGLFAIVDEWFKKNWLVIDFEQPAERNRLWLNVLDAEQNYGVIAMRAGPRDSAIVIDGRVDDWRGRPALYVRDAAAEPVAPSRRIESLSIHQDEAYVHLRLQVGAIDWSRAHYLVGIDTYDAARGDTRLPYTGSRSPVGLEFVLELKGPEGSQLLVDSPYNLYREVPIAGARPPATQTVYNRPFRTEANSDGRYDTLRVTPNRRRIGRDGTVYPARQLERNRLLHASQRETTLADWFADTASGTIEVRLPWGLLHVLDPSSRNVLFGPPGARDPEGVITPGFRFIVESFDPAAPAASVGERLPRASGGGAGAAAFAMPPLWSWPTWEVPRWHAERKPLFEAMRETFARIPDAVR
jgi:tetratricopeptide (TPR) repeat protein